MNVKVFRLFIYFLDNAYSTYSKLVVKYIQQYQNTLQTVSTN